MNEELTHILKEEEIEEVKDEMMPEEQSMRGVKGGICKLRDRL